MSQLYHNALTIVWTQIWENEKADRFCEQAPPPFGI